ncbi:unnamed protein product, partial [Didymodactylos carnosus]
QCDVCNSRQAFPKPIAGKPIISVEYLTRVQMDLIDMHSVPDGEFKWILHVKDHFTKFSWAYPLQTKEAAPVPLKLLDQFYSFGPPRILQFDNGQEFIAQVIKNLRNTWKDLVIINGRPRHPQTQGLVERANHTLQLSLGKWMQSNNTTEWAKGLKPVIYSINTKCAQTTKKSPYEVVFGQKPRSDFEMWKMLSDDGIEDEEQMPADFIQMLNEQTTSSEPDGTTNQDNDEIYDGTKSQHQQSPVLCLEDFETDRTSKDHEGIDMDVAFDCIGETMKHQAINRHKRVREGAEDEYLKVASKRQRIYDESHRLKEYKVGDIVGLKIAKVDHLSVTPTVLPCKVISIQSTTNDTTDGIIMYKLCTTAGVISTRYTNEDLLNLAACNFSDLRLIDPGNLPQLTFIQACKEYANLGTSSCNCKSTCSTKTCPCKSKGVLCCTKCHPKKKCRCLNV